MPVRRRRAVRQTTGRRATVLATAAFALSMLAAACGGGSAGSSADPASASGASGTLNWEWELPTSWDPVTSTAGWDVHVLGLVYASLTTLNPKGDVEPGLASSWKYAADGKSVTFTLRPGLKFTDGTPLTAQAVAANIDRAQTQANSTIASELAVIAKVVVNSPTSFTLDLTQVDYQVPYLLAGKDGMMVSPAAFKDAADDPDPPGRGRAVQADQLRPRLARQPGAQPRLLGRQPDPPRQLHGAVDHPAVADPRRAAVRAGQRGLHRGQPGGGRQGGRLQDRGHPVRGRQRARHPDDHEAVHQPGRGQGDQLRDRPEGDRPGAGLRLRLALLPAVPRGLRRLRRRAWPTCTRTTRPRPGSCSPPRATRTG